VGKADTSFARLIARPLRGGDVLFFLHADADQVRPERFSQVEMRGDVSQQVRAVLVVGRHRKIAGHHGNFQPGIYDLAPHTFQHVRSRPNTRLGSAHTKGLEFVLARHRDQLVQSHRGLLLIEEVFCDANRQ
jgi:hypothetical protein